MYIYTKYIYNCSKYIYIYIFIKSVVYNLMLLEHFVLKNST